jgi:8-oxo-dGTP pyrophosphatase MutT (NUDIX family)
MGLAAPCRTDILRAVATARLVENTPAMLLERQEIFSGRVIKVSVDQVQLPNGMRIPLEIVRHPGGAAVVAIDAQDRICLLRQFRHVAGGYIYELPAGKLEPDEPPEVTARRELAEEGAVSAVRWEPLGAYFSSPGCFTEVIHLYLATELDKAPGAPEADEVFQVEWWPFEKAMESALNGEFTDAKTIIGILRAASRKKIA